MSPFDSPRESSASLRAGFCCAQDDNSIALERILAG